MTMTKYVPSWEKKYDPWDREPEYWENDEFESENEKVADEISLDFAEIAELDEMELDESEFDNDFEQTNNYANSISTMGSNYLWNSFRNKVPP